MVSLPPSGIASRALTARLTITCSNCEMSALTCHRSRPCTGSNLTFSPIRRRSSIVNSVSASPRSSTCGRRVCLRENASSCRTSVAARFAFCLICMMSWNKGSVGLCALSRKSLAIMMAESTLLKSCAMPPASMADHVHLLRLVDLVLQRAPLGRLQHVDDGGFGLAFVFLDRGHEELPPALAGSIEHQLDRRDVALPLRRLVDGRDQEVTIAGTDGGKERLVGRAIGAEALRQFGEPRIGADHSACAVDRRNRHRGVIEEAHETGFARAQRIGALIPRAADRQRARRRRARHRRRTPACDRAAPGCSCRCASADRCRTPRF